MTERADLAGKVAVVTGGGRGVGRAISLALARAGAQVHVIARTAAQVEETVRLIEAAGGQGWATTIDVTRPDQVTNDLKERVHRESGPPQILINAAGIFGPLALVHETDPRHWIETINVNLIASYLTCRVFLADMLVLGWGRVVNVTSAAALHQPGPLNSAYGTSKVALTHFTRHLAAEIVGTGVTANLIHPGEVKTDMWREIKERANALGVIGAGYRSWADGVGETGGDPPEKAAELVMSLMGDDAASVNGQFLWIREGQQKPIPTDWS